VKLDEVSPIANSVRRVDMSQGNLQRPHRQFHGVEIHAVVTKSSSSAKTIVGRRSSGSPALRPWTFRVMRSLDNLSSFLGRIVPGVRVPLRPNDFVDT